MPSVYWPEIQAILTPGLGCMANVVIATDEGVFNADFGDYESVKRLHKVIAAALNAWERDTGGQWKVPPKSTKPNSMPPGAPLPVENVDKFLTWVAEGMPEAPLVG